MNTWENPLVADLLDELLHEEKQEFSAIVSRLPSLFGVSEKATFLGYRSLGLDTRQTLEVMGLEDGYLDYWRNTDPMFLEWEAHHIQQLQGTLSVDLVKIGFLRNMALFIAKDASIIRKFLTNTEGLSKREYDYVKVARRHYTSADMLALEKALEPEKHREHVTINLTWGDNIQAIEGVEAPYQIGEYDDDSNPLPQRVQLPYPQETHPL